MLSVNRKRLVDRFIALAKIKSPSGQEEELANYLIEELRLLGLSVQRDNYGNVIAKLSGGGEPLILCAHMDTVPIGGGEDINPTIDGDFLRSDGTTILGADNKDYIAAILETIALIVEGTLPHRSLELVFTKEEEAISKGAKNLDFSLLEGKECLISDSSDPFGVITLSAPSCARFEITIRGKRSHVKNPEKGINAIRAAALIISRIPLGRVDDFTTTNIGFVVGGIEGVIDKLGLAEVARQSCNNVPDFVKIYGEARGPRKDSFEDAISNIAQVCRVVENETLARVEFNSTRLADGYFHAQGDDLIQRTIGILREQLVEPVFIHSVGGSDANIFNARGIKTVVISSAHRNNHELTEYLIVDDLVKLTDFLINFVGKL